MSMPILRLAMLAGIALLPLSWVALPSYAGTEAWVTVAPPSEGFEVQMPWKPKRTVKETSTFLGSVDDVSYRVERGDQTFVATWVDLPGVATLFLSDAALLENIRESFLEKGNGKEKSYQDIVRDGRNGKRLEFAMHKSSARREARAEFFLIDGRMLSFTGIVNEGEPMDDVERFLGTIKLHAED